PSRRGQEGQQLGGERSRVGAAPAADPGAVLVRDERGQLHAVVVRRDGGEATAADRRHAGALGLDAAPRLGIVRARDELLLAGAYLQRERPLARLRQQLVRLEAAADLGGEPEPVEP